MIFAQKVQRVENSGIVLAEKSFVQYFCIFKRAKVLRLDDSAEVVFGDDVRADQKIIDELTAIKPAIGFLVIYVVTGFQNTAKVVAEGLFVGDKLVDIIFDDGIRFVADLDFQHLGNGLKKALISALFGVFDHKPAPEKDIRIQSAERIHLGKVFFE